MEHLSRSPVKRNPCGKHVSSNQKQMIINIYKSKIAKNPNCPLRELRIIISKELGIGQTTISNTITEYKNNKSVSSPNRKRVKRGITINVDDLDKNTIRRLVHQFWFNCELPTLGKMLKNINQDIDLPTFSKMTLYRLLKSMNFVYTKIGRNNALIEKDEIILWRRKYLKNIRQYRDEGRPIYYLDETWVNVDDIAIRVWQDETVESSRSVFSEGPSTGPVNPTSKGNRLIVTHIGSADGFVDGALLCLESKKNSNDYHDEINGKTFQNWMEIVLPKLPQNSVIVMDNNLNHSVKFEKIPLKNWRKADVISWLESKGEIIHTSMIMAELMEIVARLKPQYNKNVIDEMAKAQNKIVLRLPPYHCELNPIEMAWSVVKSYVNSNNKTFKLADVKNLLVEGIHKVDSNMWKYMIKHTITEEDKFWNIDFVVDELIAKQQDHILYLNDSNNDNDSYDSDL